MKIMGIDYGSKQIGVALSDDSGRMAFPKEVVANNVRALAHIKRICDESYVGEIVLGESLDYKNNPNPIMADIERFAGVLRGELGLTVHLEPEFMSSAQAEQIQGKTKGLDASAAAIILQSFLDKKNNRIV